ncbi:MAG: 30S ribosomal protein S21 [Chloroflexi bacterium]|nr:30S ribosomal protein S21 [Chloroflexota bacterium]
MSIHEGESQEWLLRRFQRMVQMSGVLREVKANCHFVPKSEAARIKPKKNAQRKRRQGY